MQIKILKKENFEGVFQGYTEKEIEKASKYYEINFPIALKEFLFLGGVNFFSISAGPNSNGFEFLKELQSEELKNYIKRESFLDFSLRYVLCASDENYWFINLFDGDNPPIYFYRKHPEKVEIIKIFNTFTEMIDKQLERYYHHFGAENLKNVLNRFS